jgi:hypothetical protein
MLKSNQMSILKLNTYFLLPSLFLALLAPLQSSAQAQIFSGAGISAIWSNQQLQRLPVVKTMQSAVEWRDVHLGPNHYDFSSIGTVLDNANTNNKYAFLQFNMPAPDWMDNEIAVIGLMKRPGTVGNVYQWWDPDYIKHHKDFLSALAQYVKNHPNKSRAVGIRVQPNALTPEVWRVWKNPQPPKPGAGTTFEPAVLKPDDQNTWRSHPQGYSASNPKFAPVANDTTPGTGDTYTFDYMKQILNAYIENFAPLGIRMAFRTNSVDEAFGNRLLEQNPLLGCLHTSISTADTPTMRQEYKSFKHCEERDRFSFWEGSFGTGPAPLGTEMYWRDMIRLSANTTHSGTRMERYRTGGVGAQTGMHFFNKYAGLKRIPNHSPGAWIVMADIATHDIRNINWFISQSNLTATVNEYNPQTTEYQNLWAKRIKAGETVLFDVADSFAQTARNKSAKINVTWFSQGGTSWQLKINNGNGLKNLGGVINGSGSGSWKTKTFTTNLSSSAFNGANDLAIANMGASLKFHMIEITRTPPGGGF